MVFQPYVPFLLVKQLCDCTVLKGKSKINHLRRLKKFSSLASSGTQVDLLTELGTRSLFPGSLSAHFYPWIAIALLLMPIFRFAHRSIALKKPVVRSWKRALKRSIAAKFTVVRSYVCIVYVLYR